MPRPERSGDELRLYFEALRDVTEGVSLADESGTILYTNPAEDEMFGYGPGELTGSHVSSLNAYEAEENARRVGEAVERLLRDGSWRGEWHNRRKDGSTFYSETRIRTVETGGGRYFLCLRKDATARHVEEALRASPFGIAIAASDASLESANPALLRILGRRWEDLPKGPFAWEQYTPSEYHEMERGKMRRLLERGYIEPFEKEFIRPDGSRVPVLVGASVLSTGQAVCYVVDLSAQHEAEQAARRFEERLHLALRAAQMGTWDWDLVTGEVSWSPELYDLIGRTPETTPATTESWFAIMHPDDRAPGIERAKRMIESGVDLDHEYRILLPDGRVRWLMGRAEVVRDSSGRPVRMVGLALDITARKEAEEVLRASNEDLQQFAYSASHDLREPIRMVAIYSQLLDKHFGDKLGVKGGEFLRYTLEGAQRMEALVRDLLAYTQAITPGEAAPTADAGEAYALAAANLAALIEESGATVEVGPLPSVAAPLTALVQVFQNVIGNAIKYRRRGERPVIRVRATLRERECTFAVEDNGIGIAPEYQAQIFGLFKRLHSPQDYSGSGMGLAICQRIVRRLGGRIWVESRPGEGSTFFFTLPAA